MDEHSYDDIINLPNPTSKNHPRMSLHDRAAQFAPFAALTGHDAAIKETARLTDERLELSDEVIMKLNDQLNMIRDNIGTEQEISITYFVPDDKKSGGAYLTHSGIVKKIDEFERKLIMQDDCKGTCHDDDTGCFENNRNYGNSRNRHEYVLV